MGLFLSGIGFISGCTFLPVPEALTGSAQVTNPATNPVPSQSSALPTLFDGFEGGKVADFWLPGNYGSGLYVPGAIKLSTEYARSGTHSVEITVHEGDIEQAGDGSTRVERAELDSGHLALRGKEAWYGFSFLIPKSFPIVDTRLVISSCKQSDVSRPIVAQRYRNGKHTLTVESQGRKASYRLPTIMPGKWVDMIFHVRYSPDKDGLLEVWEDGSRVVRYAGPTAEAAQKDAFYNKIGLYRDRLKQPMTLYYDNYTLGASKEAVDPVLKK